MTRKLRKCLLMDCENTFKPVPNKRFCCEQHRKASHEAKKRALYEFFEARAREKGVSVDKVVEVEYKLGMPKLQKVLNRAGYRYSERTQTWEALNDAP